MTADQTVLVLDNADVAGLLDMSEAMAALRVVFADFARGDATYVPRIDVFAPTGRSDDFYQWGSMAGVSLSFGVLAVRMKSDVVSWPHGQRQEKYAATPGLFCGLVLVFDISSGVPLAIVQDGYLQHLRVGAAAGIGTDVLARRDASSLGILGSGGMAQVYLDAIAAVRNLDRISVYSPNARHRQEFAERAAASLGVHVTAVASPQEAVCGHDIVATATSSMMPTFDAGWLATGAHVTCVTRRELSPQLIERSDRIVQLGLESVPRGAGVPMMEWKAGGMAAYVCGPAAQRARIPLGSAAEVGIYPTLVDVQAGRASGRQSAGEVTLFINVGTQGLQFAAVAGTLVRLARAADVGKQLPAGWFLGDVRD